MHYIVGFWQTYLDLCLQRKTKQTKIDSDFHFRSLSINCVICNLCLSIELGIKPVACLCQL